MDYFLLNNHMFLLNYYLIAFHNLNLIMCFFVIALCLLGLDGFLGEEGKWIIFNRLLNLLRYCLHCFIERVISFVMIR
jgi:hypothetical protein